MTFVTEWLLIDLAVGRAASVGEAEAAAGGAAAEGGGGRRRGGRWGQRGEAAALTLFIVLFLIIDVVVCVLQGRVCEFPFTSCVKTQH